MYGENAGFFKPEGTHLAQAFQWAEGRQSALPVSSQCLNMITSLSSPNITTFN
jgi:hypothetical protein